MTTDIELLDQKRMSFLAWFLIGSVTFLFLTITRFFFRASGLNAQPVGTVVLVGLIITLLLQAYCTIGISRLTREIRSDPRLEAALNNELIRSLETRSWKAAYLGAAGTTLFFAVVWYLYPICDPVMVVLTAIIAGAAAYRATFYFKYRSS